MPTLDSTAQAQIASGKYAPAFFVWIDILGDPIRLTTFGQDVTFAATGDPDLDGNLFHSFDHRAINVGDISNTDNGSDTLTVTLSSIASIDSTLMTEIASTSNWRGRTVRVWTQVYDATGVTKQGAIVPFYTGYASSVKIMPAPDSQSIALEVENYLALFSAASNRSYLNQAYYDAADTSAAATLAAANMGHGVSTSGSTGSSGGGYNQGRTKGNGYNAEMGYQ
jgi:hypothetical protein